MYGVKQHESLSSQEAASQVRRRPRHEAAQKKTHSTGSRLMDQLITRPDFE